MGPVPPLVYRPTFVRVLTVITWVMLGVALLVTTVQDPAAGLRWAPVLALMAAAVYTMFWRPSVEVDDEAVTIRNLVRDTRIPWGRLDSFDTRYSLTFDAQGRRVAAWAAPAPGRSTALRQSRKDAEALSALGTSLEHGLRSSATPNSDSGGAALMVRARWDRFLNDPGARTGEAPPVTAQVATVPVAALALSAAGTALSLVLS
jgi:hypothetical protein